jgi:hypothetical protein
LKLLDGAAAVHALLSLKNVFSRVQMDILKNIEAGLNAASP